MIKKPSLEKNIQQYTAVTLIVFLIITIPIVHDSSFFRYRYDSIKFFLLDFGMSFLVLVYIGKFKFIRFTPLLLANISFLLMMVFSIIMSSNKIVSIEYILRHTNTLLLIGIIVNILHSKIISFRFLAGTILVSSTIFGIYFIYGTFISELFTSGSNFSSLGHFNYTGHVLNVLIPFMLISFFSFDSKIIKVISIATLICLMQILIMSSSRGSIVGLMATELLITFIVVLKYRKLHYMPMISTLLIIIFYINVVFFPSTISASMKKFNALTSLIVTKNTMSTFSNIKDYNNQITAIGNNKSTDVTNTITTGRMNMYINTLVMIKEHPFGVGINNFEYIHPKYAKYGTSEASPVLTITDVLKHPHNLLLKYTSELGIVGGLIFLVILGLLIKVVYYNTLHGDRIDMLLAISFGANVLHAMVSAVFLTPASILFVSLLISVILYRYIQHVPQKPLFESNISKSACIYYGLIGLSFFVMYYLSKYYDAQFTKQRNFSYNIEALKVNPWNDSALISRARFEAYANKDFEIALDYINRYLFLYPYSMYGLQEKIQIALHLKRYDIAKEAISLYLSIDSSNRYINEVHMQGTSKNPLNFLQSEKTVKEK